MRARLVHTHEYASRVYGDPASADDEDDDADAEGKPKKAGRVKKSKGKSKKSKGKSADSFGWIFDEGGGALGDLAALPSPGTCPAFDDALHDDRRVLVLDLLEELGEGGLAAVFVFFQRRVLLRDEDVAGDVE